jgi:hypothetical protein
VADKGQFHSALLEQKEGPFCCAKKESRQVLLFSQEKTIDEGCIYFESLFLTDKYK